MQKVYLVTMWSGGRPAKNWKTNEAPELLANGTGVRFVSRESKLTVSVIGSISIEEFESGKEELELELSKFPRAEVTEPNPDDFDNSNIEKLF